MTDWWMLWCGMVLLMIGWPDTMDKNFPMSLQFYEMLFPKKSVFVYWSVDLKLKSLTYCQHCTANINEHELTGLPFLYSGLYSYNVNWDTILNTDFNFYVLFCCDLLSAWYCLSMYMGRRPLDSISLFNLQSFTLQRLLCSPIILAFEGISLLNFWKPFIGLS